MPDMPDRQGLTKLRPSEAFLMKAFFIPTY